MLKNCLILFTVLGAACAAEKDEAKGFVDDSLPPEIPSERGKSDGPGHEVALDVQSLHPYANHLDRVFSVPLTSLPSCATSVRLHFSVLRTEANYDFVTVEPVGAPSESFDGTRDGTWTRWFEIRANHVNVRLETDGSITRHGFAIDKLAWDGVAVCPAITWPDCDPGTIDVSPPPPVCGCQQAPQCAPIAQLAIRHGLAIGRNNRAHSTLGTVASETHPGPFDAPQTTVIGSVDAMRLTTLVRNAAGSGLFATPTYDTAIPAGATREELHLQAGPYDLTFVSAEGTHAAGVQRFISDFEALFACDNGGGGTCGSGFECQQGECVVEQGCVCPAVYDPVCGTNGHTYSNGCAAGCANAPVAHAGECGQVGDTCGTLIGLSCLGDHKCRFGASQFTYPYPDAGGTCVAYDYCDAPADCNGLIHIAVPGSWQCNSNQCAYQVGLSWQPVPNGRFETAHPYASSTSVWKDVYLPANAQALRLVTSSFRLEANYDFLEVWTWINGQWKRVKRYTGTTGPAATDEFPGRYHYLRFVSDSSVTDQGFRVDAQWR